VRCILRLLSRKLFFSSGRETAAHFHFRFPLPDDSCPVKESHKQSSTDRHHAPVLDRLHEERDNSACHAPLNPTLRAGGWRNQPGRLSGHSRPHGPRAIERGFERRSPAPGAFEVRKYLLGDGDSARKMKGARTRLRTTPQRFLKRKNTRLQVFQVVLLLSTRIGAD
jgi:hypothetical protein